MTDEQKYNELLKELAEIISTKNERLQFKDYELDRARRLLEAAENEIEKLKNGTE